MSISDLELLRYAELETDGEDDEARSEDRPVITSTKDWTVSALRDKYEKGKLSLQPKYQREYVWELKPELPSRLIESILLNIPVPPIYFAEMPTGNLEVIDGQQRLTTLIRYIRNEFRLQKLSRLSRLNNLYYKDLADEYQERILDFSLHSVVLQSTSDPDLRYEVFERLNRGSMSLNEQEIRNCVYRGDFCDLLTELEQETNWRKIKGGVEPEHRFIEREIILRFFAFAYRIDAYRGSLKSFLNDYMGKYAPDNEQKLKDHKDLFIQTMRNIYTVFGSTGAARLYSASIDDRVPADGKWELGFSVSALDIQASALIGHDTAKVQVAAEQIREAYLSYLLTNPQVRQAISLKPSGTNATKTRWFGFKAEVLEILNGTRIEPRFFSFEFRRQLWENGPVCMLCNNEIHSFEDCTVDHIIPYSKAGKTKPTNGQLAHRSCNARKSVKIM